MSIWQKKAIKLLGRVVTGKTPPKEIAEYWDGDELFVSPKDMARDSRFIQQTQSKISKKALNKFKGQVLPKNSVMYTALSYGFGKIGIAKQQLITNQQINSIIVYKDHDFRFVYYLLRVSTPYIFSFNSGIDTPIVPKSVFEKIELLVPSFNIQRKIAAVLSAYDDLIENNNRRIAILEKMAEELYREWFVRLRFPGHEKTRISKGIPEGWELQIVDKTFEFLGGGTPSTSVANYWQEGTIDWYSPTDLTASEAIFSFGSKQRITEEGLNRSSARLFPAYSIMMTSRATIGQISINTTSAATNQGFITCIPNKKAPLCYLFYWLKLNKDYFVQLSNGATFLELTKGRFKKVYILIPSQIILKQFESKIQPIFNTIEKLLLANDKLTLSRDKLLSRLMSGKIDLENLDIQFPASMQENT